MRLAITCALLSLAAPLSAGGSGQTARAVLESAVEAAGGDAWLDPRTLVLSGSAEFYAPDAAHPVTRADEYRMWRKMGERRTSAHAPDGKVRIVARTGGRTIFEVGYDGETTWNQDGVVPRAEAEAMWASNFGFGIIREALGDGFTLERAPDRDIGGHALDMIRVIDPAGQPTLFGIDRDSRFIRYVGFATPRGWHERVYDDFMVLENPRWVQAREVTLFYDGVRANTVHWTHAEMGAPVDDSIFAWRGAVGDQATR